MSAEIIWLPTAPIGRRAWTESPALTAREVLIELALELSLDAPLECAEIFADQVAQRLSEHGYIIAPATDTVTR